METDERTESLAPFAAVSGDRRARQPRVLMAVLSLWLLVGLAGCTAGTGSLQSDAGDTGQTSPQPDTTHRVCSPGDSSACVCSSGASGTKTCRSDGSWEKCECKSPDTGVADTHDAVDTSSRSDTASPPPDWSHSSDVERTLVARQGASGISVDGKLDETRYRRADRVAIPEAGGGDDNRTTVRALWNDDTLYLGFAVEDAEVETPRSRDIWKRDSVQMFIDRKRDRGTQLRTDDYAFVIDAEGRTRTQRGTAAGQTEASLDLEVTTATTSNGYRVEMAIPWSDLEASPTLGDRIGIMFANHDRAGSAYESYIWGNKASFTEPSTWGDLRLGPADADDDPEIKDDEDSDPSECEPKSYDTIKVPAGERRVINIDPGETFSNKLIDISARSAHVKILTQGSGWTVRDIGIKGKNTDKDGTYGVLYLRATDGGEGVAENIYMGDGGADRVGHAAVSDWDNSGTVTIRNIHVANWPAGAMYLSHAGVNKESQGGNMHVENAFLKNNNIENIRLGGLDSSCKNCVIHVEGRSAVSSNESGQKNPRGLWFNRQPGNKCVNCDIKVDGAPAVVASDNGTGELIDSRVEGAIRGPIQETNVSGNPDLTPPPDVPMSAEEAASGC